MEEQSWLIDLAGYARRCLDSDRYPADSFPFEPFGCAACGLVPFAVRIEHHSGSQPGDFKGVITGRCTQCATLVVLYSFTGEHRLPEREDNPVCACGGGHFWVAGCEHTEGEGGLPGFFDEGVVVARCAQCGRHLALVYTD